MIRVSQHRRRSVNLRTFSQEWSARLKANGRCGQPSEIWEILHAENWCALCVSIVRGLPQEGAFQVLRRADGAVYFDDFADGGRRSAQMFIDMREQGYSWKEIERITGRGSPCKQVNFMLGKGADLIGVEIFKRKPKRR